MLSYSQYKLISESIVGLGTMPLGFGKPTQYINSDQELEEGKKKYMDDGDEEVLDDTDDYEEEEPEFKPKKKGKMPPWLKKGKEEEPKKKGKMPFFKKDKDVDVEVGDDEDMMDDESGRCSKCKAMSKHGCKVSDKHGRVHNNGLRMQNTKTETVEMTSDEKAFWDSLKNQMYSDPNHKYYSGLNMREDKLLAPAGDVTGEAPDGNVEPGPGEIGYSPSTRIGYLSQSSY